MIIGIGIDIVDLPRFIEIASNQEFRARYFSIKENGLKIESLAGRFAAKEALFKALDVQELFCWDDVEIISNSNGTPIFNFKNYLADYAKDKKIFLSISHSNDKSIAIVIIENSNV